MSAIQSYYEMMENVIRNLGVDPAACREAETAGQWNMKRGSVNVWIDIFPAKNDTGLAGYLQIMSPICEVPTNNTEAFYAEVLETSHDMYAVGFTKYDNWIYVKTIRELDGIDESEMSSMLNRVGYYGDLYDDHFKNKYFPSQA